jgi:hypothetical protein
MSDEQTRLDSATQAPVPEPAKAESDEVRFLQTSFAVVIAAIFAVVMLVGLSLVLAALQIQGTDTDAISTILGTGTTLIGTLVGSFLGLRQGQQGRDEAQERAEQSRQDTERVLWSALAHVPSDKAEEILRSARSSGVRTS